jgi:folate-binding protein YgfZ
MDAQVSDPLEEVRFARERVAYLPMSDMGLLQVSGDDRAKFLQGQVTADVAGLKPGGSAMSCIVTAKGRMLARFEVLVRDQDILLMGEKAALKAASQPLMQAVPLTQSRLKNISADYVPLWIVGPAGEALVDAALEAEPDLQSFSSHWNGAAGYLLLCPVAIAESVSATLHKHAGDSLRLLSPDAAEVLRVEGGAPKFAVDYSDETFPQELGLDRDISFTKGCFLGQETLAHIKNRGHLNRKLVGVKIPGKLSSGWSVLVSGNPIGKISSAVFSPELGAGLGLAIIAASHVEPGSLVTISGGGGSREAEVLRLPVRI